MKLRVMQPINRGPPVLPMGRSSRRPASLVFLEANACGKPVVGGRSGGVVEAIVDNETGFLVDPYSPDDIAKKIGRLLLDDDLAKRLGDQGRRRVLEQFTWDRVGGQTNEVIRAIEEKNP
jgi:glycosyltransferase involved in cell wall biosynthesis